MVRSWKSQLADALDDDVGRRMPGHLRGVVRVMALAREHGGHAVAPGGLERAQDARLVVDDRVVARREQAPDVVEHRLLVDVDQHAAVDRVPQPRALDLAWLEDDVAVGQDHRRPDARQLRERVERAGEDALAERVVDQEARHLQQRMRLDAAPRHVLPVQLQRAEVVGVAELVAQLLEARPVQRGALGAERAHQVLAQVLDEAVVVEQGVVDVDQEDHVVNRGCHR
jgi:hypothetical protein